MQDSDRQDRDRPEEESSGTLARPGGRRPSTPHPYRALKYVDGSTEPAGIVAQNHPQTLRWVLVVVTVIAVVMVMGMLYVASDLFVPIVIATLAYLTLRPLVTKICQHGLHQTMASVLVITAIFSLLAVIVALLYSPAQKWLEAAPESLVTVREKITAISQPLTAIDRADETIDEATTPLQDEEPKLTVSYEKPSLIDETTVINQTGKWLAFIVAVAVLTFFMLSTGDDLLNRLLGVLPDHHSRENVLEKISDIQTSVGRYLAQITAINTGLGVAVTIVMYFVGMPTPVLWGVLAALFNFIPYVGPLAATAVVFLAAAGSFNTIAGSALAAFAFWLTTAVEGQLVTPAILGRTLRVGPVVVLVAVAFWGFLWGLPGVFLAVPLLIVLRKVLAGFDATHALAVVLGEAERQQLDDCETLQEDKTIAEVV